MTGSCAALVVLLAVSLAGCSIPSWVPLIGQARAVPNVPPGAAPPPASPLQTKAPTGAPVLPGGPVARAPQAEEVLDRVICVVNNDAITLFQLDEAEAYQVYESKEEPKDAAARQALRDQLLQRLIDNRLQLQQAERDRIVVEEAEIAEQLAEIRKKLGAATEAQLEETLKAQGVTLEGVKRRVRDQLMVQRVVRRKVSLRVSVTEQEIDRYLAENREKLETGLSFGARHILFLPEAGRGEDGWTVARRRAGEVYALLLGGTDFPEMARKHSDDGSGKDGGALGTLKRGELAPEIEAAILKLQPGEVSAPFRSEVGYHLFKLESKETLVGDGLVQARNQIREILFREKHQARFRDWLAEIKQRAIIDRRL
ncbi:MAG: peptidylprolyl isomerase [Candidatus Rokubacteria bacterium]|nr:peptidylprolyl isomerase [Candidatus Rokubacteria bacterium]